MGQTEYADSFIDNFLSSVKWLATQISTIMGSGSGSGALGWFGANWLKILIGLVIVGIIIDWIVWMIRWRPYWLWFRKKRVVLDDDFDEYESYDEYRQGRRGFDMDEYDDDYYDDEPGDGEYDEDEFFEGERDDGERGDGGPGDGGPDERRVHHRKVVQRPAGKRKSLFQSMAFRKRAEEDGGEFLEGDAGDEFYDDDEYEEDEKNIFEKNDDFYDDFDDGFDDEPVDDGFDDDEIWEEEVKTPGKKGGDGRATVGLPLKWRSPKPAIPEDDDLDFDPPEEGPPAPRKADAGMKQEYASEFLKPFTKSIEAQAVPARAAEAPKQATPANAQDKGWRTGYTEKFKPITEDTPGLSRRARRKLKDMENQ